MTSMLFYRLKNLFYVLIGSNVEHNGSNVDLSINMDIYNAAQNVYIT